jgi:hypothetical protein
MVITKFSTAKAAASTGGMAATQQRASAEISDLQSLNATKDFEDSHKAKDDAAWRALASDESDDGDVSPPTPPVLLRRADTARIHLFGLRICAQDDGVHPFPPCVDSMDPQLAKLFKDQLRGFRKHMKRVVEHNQVTESAEMYALRLASASRHPSHGLTVAWVGWTQLEDLYALQSLFQAQVINPFIHGMAFKKIVSDVIGALPCHICCFSPTCYCTWLAWSVTKHARAPVIRLHVIARFVLAGQATESRG